MNGNNKDHTEEKMVEVSPHVFAKPYYELELWSRSSKQADLLCEGKIICDTYARAVQLMDEQHESLYESCKDLEVVYIRQKAYDVVFAENDCLKQWKFVHGILVER